MKKGKFTALIMAIAMSITIFLTGCGGGNVPNESQGVGELPEDLATLQGSIKVALPSTGNKRDLFLSAIEKYNKSRPNVNVEVEWKPSDNFYLSYQTDVSSGLVFPDVAYIDHVYIQSLAALNLVASVDDVIKNSKDNYVENLINANKLDGKTYGFPFVANTIALYYNKKILGSETAPSTYEQFKTICAQIEAKQEGKKEKDKDWAFSLSTGSDYKDFGAMVFLSWLKRNGGKFLSDDLKTSVLDSPEVVKTLNMWKEIGDNNWANPKISNEGNFYLGKVGMIEMGCWSVPKVFKDENADESYGVAPLIEVNGKRDSALGLYSLCVTNQNDKNKMLISADFCNFISNDEELQLAFAKETKCLPVLKTACQDDYFKNPHWKPFVDALESAAVRPGSPEWPAIEIEVGNMFMRVVLGKKTAENAASEASRAVQKKLDEFYKGY